MYPGLNLDLVEKYRNRYSFFWSGPFSNWYSSEFIYRSNIFDLHSEEVEFNCAEQFMMAHKAHLFGDDESAKLILQSDSPAVQKKLGRQVKNFNPLIWDSLSRFVVYQGCYQKFLQNPGLKEDLIRTSGTLLVEASPEDKVWGIGMKWSEAGIHDCENWKGKNWLGETLTLVRDHLISEEILTLP